MSPWHLSNRADKRALPLAVQLDNDEHSWSVTADCHDSLFAAVRDATSQADVELLKDKTNA